MSRKTDNFVIDKVRRLVVTHFSGDIDASQVKGYHRALALNSEFDPSFSEFVDASAATTAALGAEALREIATLDPFAHDGKRAIVAPKHVVFGLARMYQSLSERDGLLICRTREDGWRWVHGQASVPVHGV